MAGVVVTSDKLIAGVMELMKPGTRLYRRVNDTSEQLITGVNNTSDKHKVANTFVIFHSNLTWYSGARGKLIPEKNLKSKISFRLL
jgi:hypothetical protein